MVSTLANFLFFSISEAIKAAPHRSGKAGVICERNFIVLSEFGYVIVIDHYWHERYFSLSPITTASEMKLRILADFQFRSV